VYVRRFRHFEAGAMLFRALKREAIPAPQPARIWAVAIAVPEELIADAKDEGGMAAVKRLYREASAVAASYVESGMAQEIKIGDMIPIVYFHEAQERMAKSA
jgi:hypothetical protein